MRDRQLNDLHLGSVLIDIKNEEWPLIISFAGLGDQFQFKSILSNYRVNVIYLRDLKHNWYLNGVPGAGKSVNEIRDFLLAEIRKHSFSKIITIGVSAGGFAAILYGILMQANGVMAFSPQTFMNKIMRLLYWDRRWKDREKEIYEGNVGNRLYLDLRNIVEKSKVPVEIHYDNSHRLDRIHALRIDGDHISHMPSAEGGHTLAKLLKENGKLKIYLDKILELSI